MMKKKSMIGLILAVILLLAVTSAFAYENAEQYVALYSQCKGASWNGSRYTKSYWDTELAKRGVSINASGSYPWISNDGCRLLSYVHITQYLTQKAATTTAQIELLEEFARLANNPSEAETTYKKHLLSAYSSQGVKSYSISASPSFNELKALFDNGGAAIARIPGHIFIVVGYAERDGKQYVQVIDSSSGSTIKRLTNQTAYYFSSFGAFKKTSGDGVAMQYWMEYSQFQSCSLINAYTSNAHKRNVTPISRSICNVMIASPIYESPTLSGTIVETVDSSNRKVIIVAEVTDKSGNLIGYKLENGYYISADCVSNIMPKEASAEYTQVASIGVTVKTNCEVYLMDEPYACADNILMIVPEGTELEVDTVLIDNYRNYWVRFTNGTFAHATQVNVVEQALPVTSSGLVYPTGQLTPGNGFDLKGKLTSTVTLEMVTVEVKSITDLYNSYAVDGSLNLARYALQIAGRTPIKSASVSNVKSLDIYSSALNVKSKGGIAFGTLPEGAYTYSMYVVYTTFVDTTNLYDNPIKQTTKQIVPYTLFTVGDIGPDPVILVNSISLNSTAVTIKNGESYTLTATVAPDNATNKNVTWSTSDTSVASVSSTGVVTGHSVGQATITCESTDGSNVKAVCTVTVTTAYADTLTISNVAYPSTYKISSTGFVWRSGSGSVKSNVNITKVTYNIYGNGQLIDTTVRYPNKPEYEISEVGSAIKVSKITTSGLYLFEIIVEDAEGKVLKAGSYFRAGSSGSTYSTDSSYVGRMSKTYGAKPTRVKSTTYNGTEYILLTGDLQWEDAEAYAKSIGGHLAVITSKEENAAVASLISGISADAVWIGGRRVNGNWTWVTGEYMTYTNWKTGNPDNTTGQEDAMNMYVANGQWNDSAFDAIEYRYFVVELNNGVTRVEFTGDDKFELHMGQNWDLVWDVDIFPTDAQYKSLRIWTDEEDILEITDGWELIGLSAGGANLYVEVENYDGSVVRDVIGVIVAPDVEQVIFNPETTDLYVGQTINLNPIYYPLNARHCGFVIDSSDDDYSVDADGYFDVFALAIGESDITYTFTNWTGNEVEATVHLRVLPTVSSVIIPEDSVYLHYGETCQITPVFKPADCVYQSIEWISSDPTTVTVDSDGMITSLKATAFTVPVTVKVTNPDGKIKTSAFTVYGVPNVTSAKAQEATVTMCAGTTKLDDFIVNDGAGYEMLTVTSSNPAVAEYDDFLNSEIIAHAAGTTTITATFTNYDGTTATAQISVTVVDHNVVVTPGTATCTESGVSEGKQCSICGEVIEEQTTVPALGHTVEKDEAVAATCTTDGLTAGSHCSVCSAVIIEQKTIPAIAHANKIKTAAVAATYTHAGNTEYYTCPDCGLYLNADGMQIDKDSWIIPMLEKEDFDGAMIQVESIQSKNGVEITVPVTITQNPGIAAFGLEVTYDASVLTLNSIKRGSLTDVGTLSSNGNIATWYFTENISGTGSILLLNFTVDEEAEEQETVVSVNLRSNKNSNLSDENGVAVPVRFTAGTVTVTRGLLGDVTGDGEVAIADVVKLNRGVLGFVTLTAEEESRGDVNGDGEIGIADVVKLNRYVVGLIETLETQFSAKGGIRARAVDANVIAVGDPVTNTDGSLSIPVTLSGNTGVAGLALQVNLEEGLTLKSITKGDVLSEGMFTVNGSAMSWYHTENIYTNGTLFYINVITEDCFSHTVSVALKGGKPSNVSDENGSTVTMTFVPAQVSGAHSFHAYDAVAVTCTTDGRRAYSTCEVCGICVDASGAEIESGSWVIPATGHKPVTDAAVAATCTETGLTEGSHCDTCGAVLVAQATIPAKGHVEVVDEAVPAVCTEAGLTKGVHCSECGEVLTAQEVIPAKGHISIADPAVAATCTTDGKTAGAYCYTCGEILTSQETIPALGHTEVVDAAIAASCIGSGLTEGKHCSVCNAVLVDQQIVPAKGHTETVAPAVEATCGASGLTEGKCCSVCGYILAPQTIIPQSNVHHLEGNSCVDCHQVFSTEGMPLMSLPASIVRIDRQAMWNTAAEVIIVPEGCQTIGAKTFADCAKLKLIYIPASVTIADDAFEGCEQLQILIY